MAEIASYLEKMFLEKRIACLASSTISALTSLSWVSVQQQDLVTSECFYPAQRPDDPLHQHQFELAFASPVLFDPVTFA